MEVWGRQESDRVSINSTKSAKFHARLCIYSHFVACWR